MAAAIMSADWRHMKEDDLTRVYEIGCIVHPDYPEDIAVFKDRFKIYPQGCFVLQSENDLIGYAISHPWQAFKIPALNVELRSIPEDTQSYYLHDIALMPEARSGGYASKIVTKMAEQAKDNGFAAMALVAVNGSQGFWMRQDFTVTEHSELVEKLKTYSEDARYMVRSLI